MTTTLPGYTAVAVNEQLPQNAVVPIGIGQQQIAPLGGPAAVEADRSLEALQQAVLAINLSNPGDNPSNLPNRQDNSSNRVALRERARQIERERCLDDFGCCIQYWKQIACGVVSAGAVWCIVYFSYLKLSPN